MRGLITDVCPECRDRIELRIGMAEPRLGAYLVALCGLLAGGGTGVLFFAMIGFAYLRFRNGPSWSEFGGVFIVVFLGVALCLTLACRLAGRGGRFWFRRHSRSTRAQLAVCGWLLPVILFLLAVYVGSR